MDLFKLPELVTDNIIHYLPVDEWYNYSLVCKDFNTLFKVFNKRKYNRDYFLTHIDYYFSSVELFRLFVNLWNRHSAQFNFIESDRYCTHGLPVRYKQIYKIIEGFEYNLSLHKFICIIDNHNNNVYVFSNNVYQFTYSYNTNLNTIEFISANNKTLKNIQSIIDKYKSTFDSPLFFNGKTLKIDIPDNTNELNPITFFSPYFIYDEKRMSIISYQLKVYTPILDNNLYHQTNYYGTVRQDIRCDSNYKEYTLNDYIHLESRCEGIILYYPQKNIVLYENHGEYASPECNLEFLFPKCKIEGCEF